MSNVRKLSILLLVISIFAVLLTFVACGHKHSFSKWEITKEPTCDSEGRQSRTCDGCGFTEFSTIPESDDHESVVDPAIEPTCTEAGKTQGKHCGVCDKVLVAQKTVKALGHTSVVDHPVAPTCVDDGKTEGAHCSVCQQVLLAQETIKAPGHTTVIDLPVPATCTANGKTEGSHCGVCQKVLVAQNPVTSFGHTYDNGSITKTATCTESGTKKFTCTVSGCGYSYSDTYEMPTLTATEIYNSAVKYVGEIVIYDKSGTELSLATGFVISADGRVVTNYHVIEGAYSAKMTIDGTSYNVTKVLAYDSTIDLAVVQIDGTNLPYANVCKNAVQVGSTVYAIGSSRGMTNTYSQGIITYADRVVDGVSHVQHDASITHGNSGGPLINAYGEVIGINTWGISDSQNLNFAVFTGELDNLTYGQALTMAEFYKKECDVYSKLAEYIISNGTYYPDSGYYSLYLGASYSSDYTTKFTRRAYYYVDSGEITLDYIIDDGDYWVYVTIDEAVDGTYDWNYFDDMDYVMRGTLYANTFTEDSLLGYSYNNISSSSLRTSIRELASIMVVNLCTWIDYDFLAIGVTAYDLGFYYF